MNSTKIKKATILVVDDKPENVDVLIAHLDKFGPTILVALNGQEALELAQKFTPDIILLDVMMPGMDGFETCLHLKNMLETKDIPVIFVSALDQIFDKVTAFSVGGVDYITKPFRMEEVLARVHTHLSLLDMRQKLQEKNEQLQQQNRELDAFAHTVAHDLNGPLGNQITSLSLLHEYARPMLDQEMQDVVRICLRAGHKMSNIIDELLLLASVRKDEVKMKPLNMANIVIQAQNRLSHMIEEYQTEIITPAEWLLAQGYAPWVEEVWANYLSNGLKYGGRPPCLELGITPQADGMIRFWVSDNGPGLTLAEQAILFTEFTRLNEIRAKGHGLGLSIVRRIVEKLGGQVGVKSEPGKGSTFYFTLSASTEKPGF